MTYLRPVTTTATTLIRRLRPARAMATMRSMSQMRRVCMSMSSSLVLNFPVPTLVTGRGWNLILRGQGRGSTDHARGRRPPADAHSRAALPCAWPARVVRAGDWNLERFIRRQPPRVAAAGEPWREPFPNSPEVNKEHGRRRNLRHPHSRKALGDVGPRARRCERRFSDAPAT